MHYSHCFLQTQPTDIDDSSCLSISPISLSLSPSSCGSPSPTTPHFHSSFCLFLFTSLSISTFQAFQLSTLHQRPDSVLQRLTRASGSTTSRHGKNNFNLITDSEEGLHTCVHIVQTGEAKVNSSSDSLKLMKNKHRQWDWKKKKHLRLAVNTVWWSTQHNSSKQGISKYVSPNNRCPPLGQSITKKKKRYSAPVRPIKCKFKHTRLIKKRCFIPIAFMKIWSLVLDEWAVMYRQSKIRCNIPFRSNGVILKLTHIIPCSFIKIQLAATE